MTRALVFTVYGNPAPQGSKRHVGGGRMVESSKAVKPWRTAVHYAALEAIADATRATTFAYRRPWAPLDGPVALVVDFYRGRPRSHYGTGRNAETLKPTAPVWPSSTPDLDKLLRSTLDALKTAGVFRDDAQVAQVEARKLYTATGVRDPGRPTRPLEIPGAVLRISEMGEPVTDLEKLTFDTLAVDAELRRGHIGRASARLADIADSGDPSDLYAVLRTLVKSASPTIPRPPGAGVAPFFSFAFADTQGRPLTPEEAPPPVSWAYRFLVSP